MTSEMHDLVALFSNVDQSKSIGLGSRGRTKGGGRGEVKDNHQAREAEAPILHIL